MYIKGGSVVDGNFYIEGGLRVNSIVDAQGNTFISTANATAKALVMFDTDTDSGKIGKLTDSGILMETDSDNGTHYTVQSTYSDLLPLLDKGSSAVSGVTYYDSGFNKVATYSDATYRTYLSSESETNTFPVAWAYAV
jgi:hypothetical protein